MQLETGKSLPFFSKYGHYVILALGVVALVNFIFRSLRGRSNDAPGQRTIPTETKELAPDEDFTEYENTSNTEDEPSLPADLEHVAFAYQRPTEAELLQRSREFYELANARRTLRYFSSDPVPPGVLRNIVRAAGTSPSGAHTEPWTFALVSNVELKRQIREIVEREEEVNYRKRMGPKWTADLKPLRTDWNKPYLTEAPYLLLVFKQDYVVMPDGRRKVHYYKEMSVAIACGILITAIQYAGLVTLTSTPLNCGPALRLLLGRPVNEKLVLLLPVGYPAEDATVPDLKRKDLDEILVQFE